MPPRPQHALGQMPVFKTPAQAKATLQDLMQALSSPDQATRNAAIDTACESDVVWSAHGLSIKGAARVQRLLSAFGLFNLTSKAVPISAADVEWDALSATARVRTVRLVRPVWCPVIELRIPVDTVLVFSADPASARPVPGEVDYLMPPSLHVTKWTEEWPLDNVLATVPWPFSIYISVLRTLTLPVLVIVVMAWAKLVYGVTDRARTIRNALNPANIMPRSWVPDFLPRSLPTPAQAVRGLIKAPMALVQGSARVLESSAQHTTEALNTLLPSSMQLPSPRVLEWHEQLHALSVQRKHELHAERVQASPPRKTASRWQHDKKPKEEDDRAKVATSAQTQTAAPAGSAIIKTPARDDDGSQRLELNGLHTRTRSVSLGSPQFESHLGPFQSPSWHEWASSPPARGTTTFPAPQPAQMGEGTTPASTVPAHRARESFSGLATERATQPDVKRARHELEPFPSGGGPAASHAGHREVVEAPVRRPGSMTSSILSSADKRDKDAASISSGKGKKSVTFTSTSAGFLPAAGTATSAAPRLGTVSKTTFTSLHADPEGALAATAARHAHGDEPVHLMGSHTSPSASIAAEQLGSTLASDEQSGPSGDEQGVTHHRRAPGGSRLQAASTTAPSDGKETFLGHGGPSSEQAPPPTSATPPAGDLASLGLPPVAGSHDPSEPLPGSPSASSEEEAEPGLSTPSSSSSRFRLRRSSSGLGKGLRKPIARWFSKTTKGSGRRGSS